VHACIEIGYTLGKCRADNRGGVSHLWAQRVEQSATCSACQQPITKQVQEEIKFSANAIDE